MGVFERMKSIMSSNVNELLDKMEDPVKMSKQMLRNYREDLADAKVEAAKMKGRADTRTAEYNEMAAKVPYYHNSALNALKSGNEDVAKQLLAAEQEVQAKLPKLKERMDEAVRDADSSIKLFNKLAADVKTIEERVENVQHMQERTKALESAGKMQEKMSSMSSANDSFARMEDKAESRMRQAEAALQLGEMASEDNVDRLAAQYAAVQNVDSALEALKAEAGVSATDAAFDALKVEAGM